jgi:quercetin dioxygenase-like cupin family protein
MTARWSVAAAAALAAVFALTARAEEGTAPASAGEAAKHVVLNGDQLQWGTVPPGLPPGAQATVLEGDPGAEGKPFTVRLRMPKGYTIPPHFHPTTENVTVISGVLQIGAGDQVDAKQAKTLKAGGFASIPKDHHHYAVSGVAGTVVQVHAIGPFQITYVNPDDDPRKKGPEALNPREPKL